MSPPRLLCFLTWFAAVDLCAQWRSLRLTLVNFATVFTLIALTIVLFGRTFGTEKVRLRRLSADPLALCLRAVAPEGSIDPTRLAQAVREHLGPGGQLRACCPYRVVDLDWFDAEEPLVSRNITGRTLAPDDPLLASCRVRDGRERDFLDEHPDGVFVTEALLDTLRIRDAQPQRLRVRVRGSEDSLPVLGILDTPLPDGLHFLLTDACLADLLQRNPDPRAAEIRTGLLPPTWAEWRRLADLPESMRDWLGRNEVRWIGREAAGDGYVWRLQSAKGSRRRSDWQRCLRGVERLLGNAPAAFGNPVLMGEQQEPETLAPARHAGIYVDRLEDLEPAARAAEQLGYAVNRTIVRQVQAIRQAFVATLALQSSILAGIALLAAWNLLVIQDLRAQQKRTETGMLKAMGMSGRLLLLIQLTEALFVWAPAAVLGVAAGLLFGPLAARVGAEAGMEHLPIAFDCPPAWLALIVALSAAIMLGTAWLATREARRAPPMETLS